MSAIISIQIADMEINFCALKDTICNSLQRKRLTVVTEKKIGGVVIANEDRVQRTPLTFILDKQPISIVQKKTRSRSANNISSTKKHSFDLLCCFFLYKANRKLNDLSMICFVFLQNRIFDLMRHNLTTVIRLMFTLGYITIPKHWGTKCFHVVAVALVNV